MDSYVLALDVGTSSLHCMLADSLGKPIATASSPMSYFTPDDCPPLAKEFDPEIVLNTLGQLTQEVLGRGQIRDGDVAAIAITSQRQGLVFLDEKGREIYSGPNVDLRAVFEGAQIDDEMGGEIYATTGHFPSFLMAPARLRWFRRNQPSTYDETRAVLTVAAWVAYRLTGSLISEPSLEGEVGLLDIRTRERCPGLMDRLGVPGALLPCLLRGGVPAGTLGDGSSRQWGLRAGIPVAVAGPDTQCGLLGMGLLREGQMGAVIGWSGAVQILTSAPCQDEGMRTWAGCYPLEGLWVSESNLGDAGNAYRWLKDTLLGSTASYEEAEELARQASAAPDGVVAFLGPGPVSSPRAGLRMGGIFFPAPLSFQEASRGQLLRAGLENIAYSVKANLVTVAEVTGLSPQVLYLGGGLASSLTLATTLASVLGFPVRRSMVPDVSARGAALLASESVNVCVTMEELAEAAASDCEELEPGSASEVARYHESYHEWLRLSERLNWGSD